MVDSEPRLTLRERGRRFGSDLRTAGQAARHNRWFVGYALIFLATAVLLTVLTNQPETWLGFYAGGVGGSSLVAAFLAYRGTRDPAAQVQAAAGRATIRHPAAETVLVLAFIASFVLVRVDELLHGPLTTALLALVPAPWWRDQDVGVLAAKFVLNVILPLLAFRALGYQWRELGLRWGAGGRLWPVFLLIGGPKLWDALQSSAGPGASVLVLAGSALFYLFGAGLPEELTNRVLLQPRLEAWLGSANAALFLQALVFALIHIPIRLMQGSSLLAIAGNLVLFVLALGVLFGFIYQRTQAWFPVAWIHALVDA